MMNLTLEQFIAAFATGAGTITAILCLGIAALAGYEKLSEGPWPTWVYGGWELAKKAGAVAFVIFALVVLAVGCVGLGMDILGIPYE